jgi:biotin carboxylase
MSNRILLLGGSHAQIPALIKARQRGLHTILCDYLKNNPGKKYANEFLNISTTDKDLVLKYARKKNIDCILAYASDPAASTAAYVAEKMGLPGNSYQSVCSLTEKDQFRQLLLGNKFPTPKFRSLSKNELSEHNLSGLSWPLIVKPVDSSGSKGVRKIDHIRDFPEAADYALEFSRSGRIIIEEFIDKDIADLHGDGFVIDGKLVFCCLGDHYYNGNINPFNPIGTTWPSRLDSAKLRQVENQIAKIIQLSGFKNGPINIEARINSGNDIYIMEIGPRNGGHYVPQAIKYSTGFDCLDLLFDLILGKTIQPGSAIPAKCCTAYYAIHSDKTGKLSSINISENINKFIIEQHLYTKIRQQVKPFISSNSAIGVLLMKFDNEQIMHETIQNMHNYVKLGIREQSATKQLRRETA